jgi:microcystin-dependent protein
MDFVDRHLPGTALDLHGATTYSPWMNACTIKPYLIKDGTVYTASIYPALAQLLGSTFGGNGITTFAVPDERARARIGLDVNINQAFSNRLTAGGSGINGTTMGAVGGSEFLQSHSHTNTLTDLGHIHGPDANVTSLNTGGGSGANRFGPSPGGIPQFSTVSSTTGISVTVNATGAGGSQNMIPAIVSFLPLIAT